MYPVLNLYLIQSYSLFPCQLKTDEANKEAKWHKLNQLHKKKAYKSAQYLQLAQDYSREISFHFVPALN